MTLETLLNQVSSVGLAGHQKPDGDCVGSTLAVYNYIKMYYPNIDVTLYLEPIPNIFKFLSRSAEIEHNFEAEQSYDLFIALDCGDEGRLGGTAKYFQAAKKTLCIDHHISNKEFADENYIFPQASSTSELVYELLDETKVTKEIAECIYVGIVHDTGVFQYSCTSAKTMNIAGKLMELGIDFSKIVDETFFEKTYQQNRILGQALIDSRLYLDGRFIVTVVTRQQMAEFQVEPKHLEGIVQQLRVTVGVEAALFLYETTSGEYKASMRSSGIVDVAAILMKFGGGGHIRAAGATMSGTAEAITAKIMAEVELQLGLES